MAAKTSAAPKAAPKAAPAPVVSPAAKAPPKAAPAPIIKAAPAPVIAPPKQGQPPLKPNPPVTNLGATATGNNTSPYSGLSGAVNNAVQGVVNNPYVQAAQKAAAPYASAIAGASVFGAAAPYVASNLNYYAQQAQKFVQNNANTIATAGSIAAHGILPPGLAQLMDLGLGVFAYTNQTPPAPGKAKPASFGKKDQTPYVTGEKAGAPKGTGNTRGWEMGLTPEPPMRQATVTGDGGNQDTPNYDYGGYGDYGSGYGGRGYSGGGGASSYGGGFGLTQWRIKS